MQLERDSIWDKTGNRWFVYRFVYVITESVRLRMVLCRIVEDLLDVFIVIADWDIYNVSWNYTRVVSSLSLRIVLF